MNWTRSSTSCAGALIQLEPKVFDLLAVLLQHRDRIVSKHELLAHLWPSQFISDATFDHCVMAARRAVGDDGHRQRAIKTVRGRGYRFVATLVAPATVTSGAGMADALSPHTLPAAPVAASLDCPQCQHQNPAAARFCTACGAPLQHVCAQCQHQNAPGSKFCAACGGVLTPNALVQARDSNAPPLAYTPPYRTGTAWAQRTLGRIAQATGALAEAEHYLHAALTTFTAMSGRFEVGRTHLALAELARHQNNREAATLHITEAHHLFTTLGVPAYVQRTVQYASRCGLVCAAPAAPLAGGA